MSTRLHIVVSDGLVERIDRARGPGQARADFIRRAVEMMLEFGEHGEAVEQALSEAKELGEPMRAGPGSVPSVEGVRPAAPAEQLEGRLRTAVKHFEPDLRELAAEAPVEKPRLFRCPACDFSAPSPKVTCARHGYRLR